MSGTETKQPEGWGWPLLSKKAHYFIGSRSLCGRWLYSGEIEKQKLGEKPQRDDCVACWRKQQKRETPV